MNTIKLSWEHDGSSKDITYNLSYGKLFTAKCYKWDLQAIAEALDRICHTYSQNLPSDK